MNDVPDRLGYETSDGRVVHGTLGDLHRLSLGLLHAVSDMRQTSAACDMLEEETGDAMRARALETAIAVCYARAFTQSTLHRLSTDDFGPMEGSEQRALHDILLTLRKKVYAHTDIKSGRSISELSIDVQGEIAQVKLAESWYPLDRELLDPIRDLCREQERRFQLDGTRLAGAVKKATETSPS